MVRKKKNGKNKGGNANNSTNAGKNNAPAKSKSDRPEEPVQGAVPGTPMHTLDEAKAHLEGMNKSYGSESALLVNYTENDDGTIGGELPGLGIAGVFAPGSYLEKKYGKRKQADADYIASLDSEGSLGLPPATDSPVQREEKLKELEAQEKGAKEAALKRIGDELEKAYPHCETCHQTLPFDPKGELGKRLNATFPRPVRFEHLVPPQFRFQVWAMLQPIKEDEKKMPFGLMSMVYAFPDINEAQAYRDMFATSEGAISCGIDQCFVVVVDAFYPVPYPPREYWETHRVFRNQQLNEMYQRTYDDTVRRRHVAEAQLKAEVPNLKGEAQFIRPEDSKIAMMREQSREGSLAHVMQSRGVNMGLNASRDVGRHGAIGGRGGVTSNAARYMGASSSTGK